MKDPFRRGCADDLPVPPSTSAQIDGLAHRRNVFDLRLPETLEARDVGIITMPIRQQVHLGWQWHPEGLESRLHLKGEVLVVSRLTAGEDCLHLELVVENLSQAD
jgi:hypothetical protein